MISSPQNKDLSHPFLQERLSQFRLLLKDRKLDGYFIDNLPDLVYFCDFRAKTYFGLIGLKEAYLIFPSLLYEHGKSQTSGFHCLKGKLMPVLTSLLAKTKFKKIGFDPWQVTYGLGLALLKMGFTPVPGLVSELRKEKDLLELSRLRAANHLAARGAEFVRRQLKPGKQEKAVAAELGRFFSLEGDGMAFEVIIAAGPNSAYPHHITSDYQIKRGDPVICDIGALWKGYHSDLTRTYALGTIPPSFSRVFKTVEKAQQEGIHRLRPGVTAASVDKAARDFIKKAGFGRWFVHSTGHGVGLEIHELPRVGPGVKDVLSAGMVVTVEPGIYLPGRFGVRIEDTLLVTPSGSEILTK